MTTPPKKKGELPGLSADAAALNRAVSAENTGITRGRGVNATYVPRAPVPTTHPRKVKGGLKISTKTGPVSVAWSGQRWMRLVEQFAAPAALAEGLVYARTGQTKTITTSAGHAHAVVQGRMPFPYNVDIRIPILTSEQWERIIESLLGEARHLASLLAGEVPASIEDLFVPLRLRLFPQELPDLAVTCTCGQCGPGITANVTTGWCKHVACAMAHVADRIGKDTFLIFALRGMPRDELLERLRAKRASTGPRADAGGTATSGPKDTRPVPAYLPRLPGLVEPPPLEQCVEHFWNAGPGLHEIELTMEPPSVSHPLLRRLGPSPFDASTGAKFPLVGLLATCYDVVTQHTLPKGE